MIVFATRNYEIFKIPEIGKEAYARVIYPHVLTDDFIAQAFQGIKEGKRSVSMDFDNPIDKENLAEQFKNVIVELGTSDLKPTKTHYCSIRQLLFEHIHQTETIFGKIEIEMFYNPALKLIITDLEKSRIEYKCNSF